jgi:hypothetical protein
MSKSWLVLFRPAACCFLLTAPPGAAARHAQGAPGGVGCVGCCVPLPWLPMHSDTCLVFMAVGEAFVSMQLCWSRKRGHAVTLQEIQEKRGCSRAVLLLYCLCMPSGPVHPLPSAPHACCNMTSTGVRREYMSSPDQTVVDRNGVPHRLCSSCYILSDLPHRQQQDRTKSAGHTAQRSLRLRDGRNRA